jgi:hypothetical protein
MFWVVNAFAILTTEPAAETERTERGEARGAWLEIEAKSRWMVRAQMTHQRHRHGLSAPPPLLPLRPRCRSVSIRRRCVEAYAPLLGGLHALMLGIWKGPALWCCFLCGIWVGFWTTMP